MLPSVSNLLRSRSGCSDDSVTAARPAPHHDRRLWVSSSVGARRGRLPYSVGAVRHMVPPRALSLGTCGRGPRQVAPACGHTPNPHVAEEGAEVAVSGRPMVSGPAAVSIMRQGHDLIVSVHTALDDSQLARFQRDLNYRIGEHRTRMVIIDVAALDVVDSFASNILSACATIARLRGTELTVVGIQPDVALTMVELGLTISHAHTALDLEDGMDSGGRPRPRPT